MSPDGYVRMGPDPALHDDESHWSTWSAEADRGTGTGGNERMWSARFSHRTPLHLLTGFVEQLVDPAPVYRGSYGLPHTWMLTQKRTSVQGEQLAATHRLRLNRVRAAARKKRKAAAAPNAQAPATRAAAQAPPAVRR